MIRSNALYVHIPFCSHLCGYCDFPKLLYLKKWIGPYLDALEQELTGYAIDEPLKTIYVGGGTPSSLDLDELERLLKMLQPYAKSNIEYTVECNIENTTEAKLRLMKHYGVTRLSFGVQSMNADVLHFADRHHTKEEVVDVIDTAKRVGFHEINVDLIYGLPMQTMQTLEADIDALIGLDVPHIATYSLTVHPHTMFYVKRVVEQTQDDSRAYYDLILKKLRAASYERYEVSNFAKPGHQSVHNQVYWRNLPYYGVGLGASGYLSNLRYDNTRNINHYLMGRYINNQEIVDLTLSEEYYLMLNLRLANGFDLDEYHRRYQMDFRTRYRSSLQNLIQLGLLIHQEGRIYPTDDGLMKLDYVLIHLTPEEENL